MSREARRGLPCHSGRLTRLLSDDLRAPEILSMQRVARLSLWLVLVGIRLGMILRSMEVVSVMLLSPTLRVLVSIRLLEF